MPMVIGTFFEQTLQEIVRSPVLKRFVKARLA
jgi:hypothetical protein